MQQRQNSRRHASNASGRYSRCRAVAVVPHHAVLRSSHNVPQLAVNWGTVTAVSHLCVLCAYVIHVAMQAQHERERVVRPKAQQGHVQPWGVAPGEMAAVAALQVATLQGLAGVAPPPPSAQLQQHQAALQRRAADEYLWQSQHFQMEVRASGACSVRLSTP